MADADHTITKTCRDCGISKSLSQFSKKPRGVLGCRPECNICRSASRKVRYHTEPDYRRSILAAQREYNAAAPEGNRARATAWRLSNPDRVLATNRRLRAANPERYQEYSRKWAANNRDVMAAFVAQRAAAKLRAAVPWRNRFYIREAYRLARLRTRVTGIEWQVDHIVPLRSKLVCGLHVEHNLQVIPASVNRKKSNRWWPSMP